MLDAGGVQRLLDVPPQPLLKPCPHRPRLGRHLAAKAEEVEGRLGGRSGERHGSRRAADRSLEMMIFDSAEPSSAISRCRHWVTRCAELAVPMRGKRASGTP